jgi:predicted branched-subunit amino acid permease
MAIDFAVPVTFIALFAPALRTLPHLAAALVSVAAALIFAGLPYSTGVLVAAGLAMVTGAEVERWQERRA